MSELKREWFEPGPDGESPFVRKYNASPGTAGEAVAAAFRALLAGEDCGHTVDAKDAEIARLTAELARLKNECSDQQSYVLDLESAIARKETRIKVLEVANDSLTQYSSNLTAERDALRARIDAGVRVYRNEQSAWWPGQSGGDTRTALLIDARPIDRDHIADPGKMVDDRTGKADRREKGCDASYEARIAIGRDHTREYQTEDIDCDGTINCARSNDRRRTAGTIADRGKPCTPA